MAEQQQQQNQENRQNSDANLIGSAQTGGNANQFNTPVTKTNAADAATQSIPDTGDGISQGSVADASGAETGGGVDTPTAVQQSDEAVIRKHKPLHQGLSDTSGGGADNGSNL